MDEEKCDACTQYDLLDVCPACFRHVCGTCYSEDKKYCEGCKNETL